MTSPTLPDKTRTSMFEVRFTNPDDWIEELKADAWEMGSPGAGRVGIEDRIVRVAMTTGPTTLEEIGYDGSYRPGGERVAHHCRSWYVEASYISSRRQLVKLSAYCGWAFKDGPRANGRYVGQNEATELKVRETAYKLQAAINSLGLEARGGGLFIEAGIWTASAETVLVSPPAVSCRHCGGAIHYASGAWRHANGEAEIYVEEECPECGGAKKVIDHGRERACPACRLSPRPGWVLRRQHAAEPAHGDSANGSPERSGERTDDADRAHSSDVGD